ncbi:RNA polymerase II-associated protein spaghetti [Leptinotarsa decemlineata]|uniref:RNA polymerase II-associated protein spaghetti n=1 Tax=Leptinotarsa decemlineata TaxID=7539 RepID=UPI003D30C178
MSVNPILLQKILRENASDLQDFSKDLKNWGEEMKRKDDSLKTDTGQSTGKVRKISKAGSTKVKVIGKPKKLTKSGTTNYAAWDKFDVDAELQKLEEDINEDSELTDECNENIYDEALIEKEKGNKFVKNQKWDEAIKSYTKAIECYSYDPVFYANRALCYLKISKFEETEKDCTLSLKLDPTYVKAYQRRAAARSNLNKLENAEMDLLKVLELEPKNKESIIELEKIRQKLNRHTEKPLDQRPVSKFTASRNKINKKTIYETLNEDSRVTRDIKPIDDSKPSTSWSPQEDIILVKPIQKPPHLRSQKPLKRISITETKGGFTEKTIESPKSQEAVKRHVVERHENIENLNELDEPIGEFKKKKAEKHLEKSEQSKSTVDFKQETQTCFKNEDFKITERTYSASSTKDVKNTVNDNKKLIECNDRDVNLATPKNSVQFYSSWRNLKTPEEKYIYLKSVKPQELPKIFLNSLESDIFSNILEVMVNYYIINKDPVFDILNYFSEVKRFSAITMFMASEDRNNLWKLFDYMKQNSERENDEIDKLRKKYEL